MSTTHKILDYLPSSCKKIVRFGGSLTQL